MSSHAIPCSKQSACNDYSAEELHCNKNKTVWVSKKKLFMLNTHRFSNEQNWSLCNLHRIKQFVIDRICKSCSGTVHWIHWFSLSIGSTSIEMINKGWKYWENVFCLQYISLLFCDIWQTKAGLFIKESLFWIPFIKAGTQGCVAHSAKFQEKTHFWKTEENWVHGIGATVQEMKWKNIVRKLKSLHKSSFSWREH